MSGDPAYQEEVPAGHDEHTIVSMKGHFTDLGTARKVKPKWIIPEVCTTGLTLIIGPAKDAYKTTLEMAFALLIARHEHHVLPRKWKPVLKGPAIIFEDEADAGELKEMCEDGMGCKVPADESIWVCDEPWKYKLDQPNSVAQMIEWIEEAGARTVGLGPLANFHDADEKDAAAVINMLRPLRRHCKDTDRGLFITHHTRKIEEGKTYSENDARGSSALFGLCDNILVITPGKEPYELLIKRKGKKGKAWEKVFLLNVWDRVGKSSRAPLRATDKMILRAVLNGYKKRSAIIEHVGLNQKQVSERLVALVADRVLTKNADTYALKESITLEDVSK